MSDTAYSRNRRDERVADDATVPTGLMCAASGCPNRWSVDGGGMRCCSAHAWAETREWPRITAQQQDAETDRAYRGSLADAAPPAPAPKADPRRLAAALSRLKVGASSGRSPRQRVVDRLREIERDRPLTLAQREILAVCSRDSLPGASEPSENLIEDLR